MAASAYAFKPLFQSFFKDKSLPGSNHGFSKKYSRNGGGSSARHIRMVPDFNNTDMELGSQPCRKPGSHGTSIDSSLHGSNFHRQESLILKTTNIGVSVTDRRPSDDVVVEKDEEFEYSVRHH